MKKKVLTLLTVLLLLTHSLQGQAKPASNYWKKGQVTWEKLELTIHNEQVVVNVTLDGIYGIQVDDGVYYEDMAFGYLDIFEDDYNLLTMENGKKTWNGEGTSPDLNAIKVIPIVPGATLTFQVLEGRQELLNFYPGYYAMVDNPQDDTSITICKGLDMAYAMDSTFTFEDAIPDHINDFIYEFPLAFEDTTYGLLVVNPDTYQLPDDIGSLEHFHQVQSYRPDTFVDIPSGEWFEKDVMMSYEWGIINGIGNNRFDPKGTLSIAAALSMACKTYEIYYGGDGVLEMTGHNWYDGIVDYALHQGILYQGQFHDYNRPITRAELASFFTKAIGYKHYEKINEIGTLPDVTDANPYYRDILTLYEAGIVTGSDSIGTFHPEAPINRAEAAAIINRVINPDARRSIVLE